MSPPQDVHKATELEKVMEKQKLKIDLKPESVAMWNNFTTSTDTAEASKISKDKWILHLFAQNDVQTDWKLLIIHSVISHVPQIYQQKQTALKDKAH